MSHKHAVRFAFEATDGHVLQARSVPPASDVKVPSGQRSQEAPASVKFQKVPGGQATQPVRFSFATLPASHSRHSVPHPALGAYVFVPSHAAHVALPGSVAWRPGEQTRHAVNMPSRSYLTVSGW